MSGVEAVQLRFAEPAAAFGDPNARPPVDLTCMGPVPSGRGRWLDDTRWTYSFERTLPAGVQCVATINPEFRDLAGRGLSIGREYRFNTGAPSVVDARPYQGWSIDEEQIFILRFDAPVQQQEVARHSHCAVDGLGERIPVQAVANEHHAALLEAAYLRESDDSATLVLLQCARVLPPEAKMRLVVGPGVRAVDQPDELVGSERPHVLNYEVRPPFTAKMSCTRERAGRPCLPIMPISVTFSAPVPYEALAGMRLMSGDTEFKRDEDGNEDAGDFISSVSYPGPFPASSTLTLKLPPELRDDANRPLANADRFPMEVALSDYPPLAKFASGTFGVIERFAHAPPGEASEQAAAVPVTLRHIERQPALRGIELPAGRVASLRAEDDADVLHWYARLQRLDSGSWTESQLKDIFAGRTPRQVNGREARHDVRSVSVLKSSPSARRLSLPGVNGAEQRPLEVVGIPLQEPGFHVLEIESPHLGASLLEDSEPMYVRTGVLLTNLSVHVKQGRDDLLVWVTTLAGAEPVPNAEIAVLDCDGRPLANGRSNDQGVWHHRSAVDSPRYCASTGLDGLFVSARIPAGHPQAHGAADYAFVLSAWDRGIETWRFNVPTSSGAEPELLTHTVYDRSLFRAGEKVSMKHYLREEVRDGLQSPEQGRPDRLLIEHEGSDQRHELPIVWTETPSGGLTALSEYDIPASAKLGSYSVRLSDNNQGWYGDSSFRVEEFRLPILTGQIALRGGERSDLIVQPSSLDVDMQLSWLSGGPASGQKVSLNAVASDRSVYFSDYEDYSFLPPPDPSAFEGELQQQPEGEPERQDSGRRRLFVDARQFVLDAQGAAALRLEEMPKVARPMRFELEASFADPSGEIQTLSQSVDVWPSAVQAGLKTEGWDQAGQDIPVSMVAIGPDAQPRPGVAMQLLAVERKTYTVRKRMVGGFYRYDSQTERTELGPVCRGETDAKGALTCQVRFERAGSYELIALAKDAQGRPSRAYTTVWISGEGELWFGGRDDDRIDLIPARREWKPGEEAEFQVRMPFREAVALVSVEREGVLWTEQVHLKGNNPLVKIPVSAGWGPNVYVSVLVLRGRLYELPWQSFLEWGWRRPGAWLEAFSENPDDVLVTSRIDLAKPAFRYGLTEIRIGGESDRLQVEVTPERDIVSIREDASVRVRVRLPDGKPAAHATVAFAAVDEALLELSPNTSWALYEAMHPRRSLAVRTATTQMEVVGRRHYGRKAVAAGGGGGAMPTRQLFDTLLSWQPMVELDADGEAEVRFRLNDSLSRFRLVAVADHGSAYFGMGSAHIVSRQDLQLVSGLPAAVREGDQYEATVTMRNGTEQEREIEIRAFYESNGHEESLPPRKQRLAPHGSATAKWKVAVPALEWPQESAELKWRFQAGDAEVGDRLALTQRVGPSVPAATVQATLADLTESAVLELPISAPGNALRGEAGGVFGGLALDASASLLGGLEGVRQWWEHYPYTCLEQSASQAVALNDAQRWQHVMSRLPTHMDDDGLLRYFPGSAPGSEVLTAYLVSVSHEALGMGLPFEIPEASLQRMLDGLQAFAEGRITRRTGLPATRLDGRRMKALEALARHGRVKPSMLSSFLQEADKWPTSTVVDWMSILSRLPSQPTQLKALAQARSVLVSRMTVSGTAMAFSDTLLNASPGLMATRVTALAELMLAVMEKPEWQDDLPRMARGLLDAQTGGRWAITTDNLLAALALQRFAQRFEAVPATGIVRASLAGTSTDLNVPPVGEVATAALDWPLGDGTLRLEHEGDGRAWVAVRAQARIPVTEPQGAGYRLERRVVPVQRRQPDTWSRGDVYRVELEIYARDSATWVVVNDPIPSGATILGSGLGRDAQTPLSQQDAYQYPPAFVERGGTGYRAYFDYLPAGRVRVSYTVRLNTVGSFPLPPSRVEALYQPDLHGSFPNGEKMIVEPGVFDVSER